MPAAVQSQTPAVASTLPTTTKMPASSDNPAPLYPDYLPYYDPLEQVEMVGRFTHDEPGLRANPSKSNLLATATKIEDLSPYCGTELHGVQLTSLSKEGLDELALMTAERGCIVLRDQEFTDVGFERQKEIAS